MILSENFLNKFSQITLKVGVNLQAGQGLEIVCPVEKSEVAEALAKTAYQLGASVVRVRWESDKISRLNYLNAQEKYLSTVPKWLVDSRNYLVEEGFCYVAISAEDPNCYSDVPTEKLALAFQAKGKALKKFSDCVMANEIRWCVVSVPTYEWAKTVFPDSSSPEQDLLVAIEKAMRLDHENPTLAWQEHIDKLEQRANYLNQRRFSYLRFVNNKGTDLKVGLCDEHLWLSAQEKAKDGNNFVANLPTEEVFTAPHKNKVFGIVKSALPLSYNGQLIDDFSLTFNKGKVVDFSAKTGADSLRKLLSIDKGVLRLGEVALIGKNSPIAQSGLLFYNTLFDENASCHLALGKAYPTTVKDGDKLTARQLKSLGANDSIEHIDFMIGTPDLQVYGIQEDGSTEQLFKDGEWCI